jgi:hypothetical protein
MIHKWYGVHDADILNEISHLSDDELEEHDRSPRGTFVRVYPSRVSRKEPDWLELFDLFGNGDESKLAALLREIYAAADGGQHRLAAMGIRALLEQIMIMQVGDFGGFDKKLEKFQEDGFISSGQREAMRAVLDVGDAAMHRAFVPNPEQLTTCLDICEGVMSVVFSHIKEAKRISGAVPPRKARLRPV